MVFAHLSLMNDRSAIWNSISITRVGCCRLVMMAPSGVWILPKIFLMRSMLHQKKTI
ncbi:hypothetical protein LSH36_275g04042 [Paralvinella palmiformis]|uniref:Uncharacterized protein n=1 Tax=Paralvinella palmiformis TaxID=53620 RepID=A0AAD9JK35_9ANNE|nr:hypothetical protein LSH36_275g04042 [Paralvinella palmiformis]